MQLKMCLVKVCLLNISEFSVRFRIQRNVFCHTKWREMLLKISCGRQSLKSQTYYYYTYYYHTYYYIIANIVY